MFFSHFVLIYQIISLEDLCKLRNTKLYIKTFTHLTGYLPTFYLSKVFWDFKCLHKAYSKPHLEDPCLAHCKLLSLSTLEGWKAKLKNHLSVLLQLLHFCFRNMLHLLSLIISCLWGCFIDMLSLKRFQFELLQEGCLSPRSHL